MNILTVIVLLILAAFAVNGWRKGFIRVFAHMFFFVASLVLVYFATPYISEFLTEYTPVYEMAEEGCRKMIGEREGERPKKKKSRIEQKKFIEELGLPEILEKQLIRQNNSDSYEGMDIDGFTDYLAGYMASLILNILTFVIALILVNVILRMTVLTLDRVAKLPLLNGVNQTLGILLGLLQGLMVVWVFFLIVTACGNTDAGQKLLVMIHESPLLEYLYNLNVFLEYLLEMVI